MPVLPDVGSRMIESGAEPAGAFEVVDQVLRGPVLDRAGRVEHLELGEEADRRLRRHARDLDERRVADRIEDAVEAAAVAAPHPAWIGRRHVSRRPSPAGR